jgi:methionyl-tRNA formyltransferase/O-antigen/teichoic acid export membrane protein
VSELETHTARRLATTNLVAQGGALACVSVASLMVARAGGAAVLGEYALLRVLPWLFGVILSCGLPTASAYFLAGEHRNHPRTRPTLAVMTVAGTGIGALAWAGLSLPMRNLFLKGVPAHLVALMAIVVITQLVTVTAKACCQGSGDLTGANLIIVAEELWFLPVYVSVLRMGRTGITAVVMSLLLSGGLSTMTGLYRLRQKGFFRGWERPSFPIAAEVAAYGARGQLGNLLWLMNLRFDFLLLGALSGPTVLGIYAVASKFAELMRLVPTAVNYVLYPRFARLGRQGAVRDARHLLPRSTALTLVLTPIVAVASAIVLPIMYGSQFRAAVLPAEIILIGLSVEGAAAVTSAFLLGIGRPGLNSWGMAAGVAVTVSMDVVLIPRYGARGAALTSAVAYLTTTVVLSLIFRAQCRRIADESTKAGQLGKQARGVAVNNVQVVIDDGRKGRGVTQTVDCRESTPETAGGKVVFVGAVHEAEPILESLLLASASVVTVVTVPPESGGRLAGYVDLAPLASAYDVPVMYTTDVNAPQDVERLRRLAPDLLVVTGWTRLIRDELLAVPSHGCVGFHASMLPKNRGRAPVNWAILRGEHTTGNTMMLLSPGVDTGDIVDQRSVSIEPDDTCGTVYAKAAAVAAEMLVEHLPSLFAGAAPRRSQSHIHSDVLPKRTPKMGITDWNRPAGAVHDWIRALTHPYPGAFSYLDGHKVMLWRSEVPGPNEPVGPPGMLLGTEGDGVRVGTGDGSLLVTCVSDEDGPAQSAADWYRRQEVAPGTTFAEVDEATSRWALGLGPAPDPVSPAALTSSVAARP